MTLYTKTPGILVMQHNLYICTHMYVNMYVLGDAGFISSTVKRNYAKAMNLERARDLASKHAGRPFWGRLAQIPTEGGGRIRFCFVASVVY